MAGAGCQRPAWLSNRFMRMERLISSATVPHTAALAAFPTGHCRMIAPMNRLLAVAATALLLSACASAPRTAPPPASPVPATGGGD
ncbi:MAG: hypothetical protein QM601_09195, partial [Pseudoxanthomonas sp.]